MQIMIVGLRWALGFCISNKLTDNSVLLILAPHFE